MRLILLLGLHYLRFTSDTTPVHKRRACYALWTTLRKRRTQTAAGPRAENYFTHSISLASIMTVYQHGEAAANQMQRIVMCLQTTVLKMGNVLPQISAFFVDAPLIFQLKHILLYLAVFVL